MEARNRKLSDWYHKVQSGEIKLPRFQRHEAWDRQRICSLTGTILRNLPLGITLVLDVGDEEKFISRYLETAPETNVKFHEHLLDGQQRLTAMWRVLHNNYERESYYVYVTEFDEYDADEEREDMTVCCQNRWEVQGKDGRRPLWCDVPAQCLKRGLIPTHLLRPEDMQSEINAWIEDAVGPKKPTSVVLEELQAFFDFKQRVIARIQELRAVLANYNLPFLSLPAKTEKSTALDVFINMNTNSKPLTQYDIIVAEVENVMGKSLHDLEAQLNERCPRVARYAELSDLVLTTSALLQGYLPNQRGAWDMDKKKLVENWPLLERCVAEMADFLNAQGIPDAERLPTNAVLAPIAALYATVAKSGDKRGQDELMLKKYMWYAFFTDRYENAAAGHAYADYIALQRVMTGVPTDDGKIVTEADVPIFRDRKLADLDQLMQADWPKRKTILGRAILAVLCRLGAIDFATGQQLTADNVANRHYHHLYPDGLLKEANIHSFLALNCSLISDRTNLTIGRKDPVVYLKDRYKWATSAIVHERLESHLIPVKELANGGYEGRSEADKNKKLSDDFQQFIRRRGELVLAAVQKLVAGHQLSAKELFEQ